MNARNTPVEDPIEIRGDLVGSGEDKLGRCIDVFWQTDFDRPNRGFIAHRPPRDGMAR